LGSKAGGGISSSTTGWVRIWTPEFIAFCDLNKIIPFCLPPHSTHLIQPLDVVVFQTLKHFHAEAIDSATRTDCSDFNKIEFLSALCLIRQQAFKETTILSAFRKTELIPWNPDAVLSRLPRHQTCDPAHQPRHYLQFPKLFPPHTRLDH